MKAIIAIVALGITASAADLCAEESFDKIKSQLAQSGCVRLEFLNTIESEIFDQVDSTFGSAWLSQDGRYLVEIGQDKYLYDRHHLYSYSYENNQVTVETVDENGSGNSGVDFVTHLDDYYQSSVMIPDRKYHLVLKREIDGDMPDSLDVFIDADKLTLERLEFFDINEELNRLYISRQESSDACDSTLFVPSFPDSVDTVRIP